MEPNSVDSTAEKRAFLKHKINDIENFEGSDPHESISDIRTVKLAVCDDGFVEKIKKGLGRFVSRMNEKKDPAANGPVEQISENSLEWKFFDESELQ